MNETAPAAPASPPNHDATSPEAVAPDSGTLDSSRNDLAVHDVVDVVILGGGAAGLTLALQLARSRPGTRTAILERAAQDPVEATHKVGESTVEIAGHYLRDVLGLGDHLTREQLTKFGLRVFFSTDDNADIARRVELGHSVPPPAAVGTYQIDRGRLEKELARRVIEQRVDVRRGHQVRSVVLGANGASHRVTATTPTGAGRTIEARWVIDATGRASLLKRQLGLAKDYGHHANAVWFRIGHPIDIDEWSDEPAWRARIVDGQRERSTNHLMGPGYWVWMIRLASGGISIGIVTDPRFHSFEDLNKFDLALTWMRQHEPQLADAVEAHRDKLQDFRMMRDYAYGCTKVYDGADRWCLTGESGLFLDPFYSPGLDLVAISNGLVTDMIRRDLDGEDVEEVAATHNHVYLLISDGWLRIYEDQYPTMGNARVMLAKVVWDTAVYWAVVGLLYFQDAIKDLIDQPAVISSLARFSSLSLHVQNFFREWAAIDPGTYRDGFVRFYDFDFMPTLHKGMTEIPRGQTLASQFEANVRTIEQLTGQMVDTVITELHDSTDPRVRTQIAAWRANGALLGTVDVHRSDGATTTLSDLWITAAAAVQDHDSTAGESATEDPVRETVAEGASHG